MRLGILSDTHDELTRTGQAIQLLLDGGAEALIHCGDLASPEVVALCAVLPCWFVFGNHDDDNVPALKQAATDFGANCLGWAGLVELSGKRIGVCHGHTSHDIRWALERPDYLLSGHSHIASDGHDGLIRRINPGALHEADEFTVALLDLDTDELRFLTGPSIPGPRPWPMS